MTPRSRMLRRAANPVGITVSAVGALLIAIVWTITFERIGYEHASTVARTTTETSNLAIAYDEHTSRTLRGIDQAVAYLAMQYLEYGTNLNMETLFDESVFTFMGVADLSGNVVVGSQKSAGINVADRDYFIAQTGAGKKRGLFIGKPIFGRVAGKAAIPMSRRINRADGSFAGVAFASVDPSYFTRFYEKAELGKGGLIGLVGLDGVVRARRAGAASSFGHDAHASSLLQAQGQSRIGTYSSHGRLDGLSRYISYRTLESYPLVVAVGRARDEALAEFDARRSNYVLISSAITLGIVLFGLALLVAINRHNKAIGAVASSEARFRATFDKAVVGIVRSSLESKFLAVNPQFCRMLGYDENELLQLSFPEITFPEDAAKSASFKARVLDDPSDTPCVELEKRYVRKDGSIIWVLISSALVRDALNRPDYLVTIVQDITERKSLRDKLIHDANHDPLTGLANRTLCRDRLRQTIARTRRRGSTAGFLFIDLDCFKKINDTLGHSVGDKLLQEVAVRFERCLRAEDTVARFGGDEFAIILEQVAHPEDCARLSQKLLSALAEPFVLARHEVFITASIGMTVIPNDSDDADTLLVYADTAMYRSKEAGRNRYEFYTRSMNVHSLENLLMETNLRRAVANGELLLHFQPKLDLATQVISGCEALVRWQVPGNGLIAPGQFIPILEQTGQIVAVGEWILRDACRQIRQWRDGGVPPVPIAVNLSARQFQSEDLCGTVRKALYDYDVPAHMIELEITESAAMKNADETVRTLKELKALGVRVSIDDFGTGYSSLAYLKRFPIDALKIDRSFVTGLPDNRDDESLVRAIITMAHSLNLKVIAEGVETQAQRAFLTLNRCDQIQGYVLSKPLPGPQFTELLIGRGRERLA